MIPATLAARRSSALTDGGKIDEYTWCSRTRRAISRLYCDPKSITAIVWCLMRNLPGNQGPIKPQGAALSALTVLRPASYDDYAEFYEARIVQIKGANIKETRKNLELTIAIAYNENVGESGAQASLLPKGLGSKTTGFALPGAKAQRRRGGVCAVLRASKPP